MNEINDDEMMMMNLLLSPVVDRHPYLIIYNKN